MRFSNYDPQATAYRAVRLAEMAGIPPFKIERGIHSTVWAQVLIDAADELADRNLEYAVRLILRTGSSTDKTLGRILARSRIATLPTEQAERLAQACLRAIEKAMSSLVAATLQPRTETAIEVLSRLVIRVNPDLAESVLNRAMEYCQNTQLAQGTWGNEIQHLLERSWEALPEEYRSRRALDLLNTPIAGLGQFASIDGIQLAGSCGSIGKHQNHIAAHTGERKPMAEGHRLGYEGPYL